VNNPVKEEAGKYRNESIYRLFRFGLQLLVFLALVVFSTLLLRPLQRGMQVRMTELRNTLVFRAEEFLGRRIEYGSMGPSLFGALEIRDIRVYASDSEPVLTIDRFRLAYSFWELVRGKIPESIHSIRIDRPVITLDLKRDADLGDLFIPQRATGSSGDIPRDSIRRIASLIPEGLLCRVRGGACRIVTPGNSISLEGLSVDIRAEEGRFLFQSQWSAAAEFVGLLNQTFDASLSGGINGEIARELNNGSLNLRVSALSGDFFKFRALTVNITLVEDEIEIRKINDSLPVDFSLRYGLESRQLHLSFRAEDFLPRDMLSFTGAWRQYNPYLGIRSSGYAVMGRSPEGELSFDIDLSGSLGQMSLGPRFRGPVSYAVAGRGNAGYFGFSRCEFRLPQGNLSYSGGLGLTPLAPNGIIHVENFSFTGDGEINGNFTLGTAGRTINLFSEDLSLGTVFFSALDGDMVLDDNGFTFALSALRFRNLESYDDVRLGTLSLEGSFDREPRRFQGSLALEAFSVLDALDMIRPVTAIAQVPEMAKAITNDISITTEVFVTTDFKHILYNAPRLVAAYTGKRSIYTLLSVSGTDRRLELSQGRLVWAEGSAEASGFADFSNPNDITFSFQNSYKEMFYYLDGAILDRSSISVHGSYGFQIYMTSTGLGGYSGYMEASSLPISLGNEQFSRLNFLFSLRYDNPDSWSLAVDHFDVQDLLTPASTVSSLSLAGGADQNGLRFRRILFDDGRGLLTGRASAIWGPGFSNPSGNIIIGNQGGTEAARINGAYRGGALDVDFSGTRVQLDRFLRNSYHAVVSGNMDLHWQSLNAYSANVSLLELTARIGDTDIGISGSASLNEEEIVLQKFRMNYGEIHGDVNLFRVNRRESLAVAAARIQGTALGRSLDMSFNTELSFAPINSWFNFQQAIDSFSGALYVQNIRLDTIQSRQPFAFTFARNRSQLSISGGPGDMLRLEISRGGSFYAAFSSPAPVRGALIGTIISNTIDAQTSNLYVDMASLWRFIVGKEIVKVGGGFVEASIRIRGSLGDPEFFGTARATSIRIQVPTYIAADIEPVPTTISLDGNEMRFGPIPARVGYGAGMVSGWFRFDRWVPNVFTLDIRVPDETPIPFGVDISGIMADGDVSGRLLLSMEDLIFTVTGDLVGNNAEIYLDTQQFSAQSTESLGQGGGPVVMDLRISTGPKVEFVYPTKDFPILRAYTESGTGIRLTSDTESGRYTVEGDINLRSGEIFYFQRNFYIREGILTFNESDIQFEPKISARAEARDRTDDGPVTVSMIIDSSPLRSFTPRFESNPPLSQAEIFSLLGQNLTGAPSEGTNDALWNFASAGSDFLTQFYVFRRFERVVRDNLRLDMFSIRTNILQNAAIQAIGLREPVDRNSGVGNYFDNTTVFLGKYFGPDVFGQMMLSFRYDENRVIFGDISQGGLTLWGGISLEADLGFEIRGPLFDMQFNFIPRHWENLFIDDLSFTLSWKKSIRNFSDLWKEL
jgi:hypothetical protein